MYCSESAIDINIGFGYLDLVHFHTSHLKTEPFYQKWPLQGTLGTLAGVLPMLFWTLLPSEGEIVEAIEFSDPHWLIGGRRHIKNIFSGIIHPIQVS